MLFEVPSNFDVESFIASVLLNGTRLESDDGHPNPCGSFVLFGTRLDVHLNSDTQAKRDVVVAEVVARGGSLSEE